MKLLLKWNETKLINEYEHCFCNIFAKFYQKCTIILCPDRIQLFFMARNSVGIIDKNTFHLLNEKQKYIHLSLSMLFHASKTCSNVSYDTSLNSKKKWILLLNWNFFLYWRRPTYSILIIKNSSFLLFSSFTLEMIKIQLKIFRNLCFKSIFTKSNVSYLPLIDDIFLDYLKVTR